MTADGRGPVVWPLSGLRIRSPRLELRVPNGDEAVELFARTPADYDTDPAHPPLGLTERPWATAHLQQFWRSLGNWRPANWRLPLAVWFEGASVGIQELEAENFAARRTVESSSFLVPEARGLGIGKEMRRAVLKLAFDHLGAQYALSGAREDNGASLGVSRALGYRDNGWDPQVMPDGSAGVIRHVLLARRDWAGADDVEVAGLDGLLGWFGA